jgi:aminoglycoside phosphotransferase (APT) family kinase protein
MQSARGWSLRPLARLGRRREDRCTWLADGEPGAVIVKLSTNRFAAERAAWPQKRRRCFALAAIRHRSCAGGGRSMSAVVDWDHLGVGSRANDLTSLLFDWQRGRLASEAAMPADAGERAVGRIVEIAGEAGLRCTVAYAAIARLALSAQRGEQDELEAWRQVSEAILGLVH